MTYTERHDAVIGYEDSKAFVALKGKSTAVVFDASSPVALLGVISEAVSTDGFADTLTRSIISNALGHQPTEDDLSHPWDENSAACLEFVSETGTTHEVSILAFHAEGEAMTLADAADILLAALSTDALATVLDHLKASGDLDESQIESELGGQQIGQS